MRKTLPEAAGRVAAAPVAEGGLNFMEAIEAHVRWKVRLEAYINGTATEELDADLVCRDDKCALGKWIHGVGGTKYGGHPRFPGLREIHQAFHRCAGEVIRFADRNERDKALDLLNRGDYARFSHQIKAQLARLSLELSSE
jgi:hypothetical protein